MKLLRCFCIALILGGFLFNALMIQQRATEDSGSATPFGVTLNRATGVASVQDFSFFWHVSDYWNRGQLERPYDSDSLIEFFHSWTGLKNPELAMRFFYHPAMLVGLVPLTWLGPAAGYGLFAAVSLLLITSIVGWQCRHWSSAGTLILSGLFCISLGLAATLAIGQLSPLFLAGLVPLVLLRSDRLVDPSKKITGSLLLFSIKPTLAFPVVVCLLAAKQGRSVIQFFTASFFILAILTVVVGWRWPFDYLASAAGHTGTGIGNAFQAGTGGATHTNLCNLLERLTPLSSGTGSLVSAGLWLLALATPWLIRSKAPPLGWAVSFSVITYLLFTPHLNRSDELLVFAPLLFLAAKASWKPKICTPVAIFCGALLFNLSFITMNLAVLSIVLSAKLVIAILLVAQIHPNLKSIPETATP
jgi:hypothetical protein